MLIPEETTENYILAHSSPESPLLQTLHRETWLRVYAPQMMASHLQGNLLRMVSNMLKPLRVLEIGTFTGYSAICLAAGLQPEGKLHTIEINLELESIASRYFEAAGLTHTIVQHFGDACKIIPQLDETFDLVYIDGGKDFYIDFYELSMKKLRQGGFILADNALWYGKVADVLVVNEKDTESIRQFNTYVQNDPRCENMILPVMDGIMLIRKL